ncbi:hypothetical protein FCL40_02660 [Ferrimonas sediminicola]|uniref:Uncharacterized protein n=1 Tax=Ferrimonas sediminicola TaxID=2569538 RepID=A0A4U1BKY8_9GAMM|nr:hypothetical protein [Ferrimonas sediminicola]TKB51474.1 hypothetical protein FCL40_02660 [Ferrimonas sediminicola]
MNPTNHGLKRFGIAMALYLAAFFVAFAPYVFVQTPEEVANMMGGAGGWAMIAALVVAMLGFVVNLMGIGSSLNALRKGAGSSGVFSLLANLLPVVLIGLILYSNRMLMF